MSISSNMPVFSNLDNTGMSDVEHRIAHYVDNDGLLDLRLVSQKAKMVSDGQPRTKHMIETRSIQNNISQINARLKKYEPQLQYDKSVDSLDTSHELHYPYADFAVLYMEKSEDRKLFDTINKIKYQISRCSPREETFSCSWFARKINYKSGLFSWITDVFCYLFPSVKQEVTKQNEREENEATQCQAARDKTSANKIKYKQKIESDFENLHLLEKRKKTLLREAIMEELFGGEAKYNELPKFESEPDNWKYADQKIIDEQMKSPIMRGIDKLGNHFFVIRWKFLLPDCKKIDLGNFLTENVSFGEVNHSWHKGWEVSNGRIRDYSFVEDFAISFSDMCALHKRHPLNLLKKALTIGIADSEIKEKWGVC